ncbi:MAG: hypothetical protein GXO32_07905 [Crenarchaeota archaeon]|nr:hypothetical protein [Thermoproteota archaeon]
MLRDRIARVEPNRFVDPELYPSKGDPPHLVAMFFLALVAIDHRLYPWGGAVSAVVNGKVRRGSEILYARAIEAYRRDPSIFDPTRLASMRRETFEMVWGGDVWNAEQRIALLRDLGRKMVSVYGSSVENLFGFSGSVRLRSTDAERPGLLDKLRVFLAYSDPVEKKSMLLVKILSRRGLIDIEDSESLRVAVDNHLARVALRLGIVKPDRELRDAIIRGEEVSAETDVLIRTCVREAWHRVCVEGGIDPLDLDDAIWSFGREVCTFSTPRCRECSHPLCANGKCPFEEVCLFRKGLALREHRFENTWWY